jgi:AmmeMemoRadiSam system protein A
MTAETALSVPRVRALLDRHGASLLTLAAGSIRHTLATGKPLPVDPAAQAPELAAPGASFVTLRRRDGALRGCIGSSRAWRSLIVDVAGNAAGAALEDPRFSPLRAEELAGLWLSISVLTAPETLQAASEAELLAKIRPGQDGLILSTGERAGVLLPQVWEMLPATADFLAALKEKAGLARDPWSASLRVLRFESVTIEHPDLFSS